MQDVHAFSFTLLYGLTIHPILRTHDPSSPLYGITIHSLHPSLYHHAKPSAYPHPPTLVWQPVATRACYEFMQKPTNTSMLCATLVGIMGTGLSSLLTSRTSRRGVGLAGGVSSDAQQWSRTSESSSKSNARSESAGRALSMSASSSKQRAGAAVSSHGWQCSILLVPAVVTGFLYLKK